MPKQQQKLYPKKGELYGYWKILETNLINPNTNSAYYKNKPVYCKCICTFCNETISLKNNADLSRAMKKTGKCFKCANKERLEKQRDIKIGDKFGKLTVIGDGGVDENHLRHYSICQCECGNIIRVKDNLLKTHNTQSCGCVGSRGEEEISKILKENNIIFDHDKILPHFLQETKRKCRFDFIIYNEDGSINRLVEFDGNQHKTGMWGGNWSNTETLEVIKERDELKNTFCLNNNYILVRIPYYKIEHITLEDIMGEKYIYKGDNENE